MHENTCFLTAYCDEASQEPSSCRARQYRTATLNFLEQNYFQKDAMLEGSCRKFDFFSRHWIIIHHQIYVGQIRHSRIL